MTAGDAPGRDVGSPGGPTARRSRSGKIAVLGVVVVVVALAVALVALVAGGARRTGAGVTTLSPEDAPLAYPGQDSISAPAPVGVPLSFGSLVLANPTDQPITITSVEVLEADDGLTVLGVEVDPSQVRKAQAVGSQAGFPAPNPGSAYQDVPVEVPPAATAPRGVDVVVGLQAARPGRWQARDLRVSYRQGGRRYVTTYRNTWVVCTDMTTPCPNSPQAPTD
jgi:hypothetical protein